MTLNLSIIVITIIITTAQYTITMATSTSSLKPGEMSEILQNEIDHIIYLPKGYETETKTPAILFLHGAGGVNGGFDNIRGQSLTKMILNKVVPGGDDFPFIVITPRADKRNWPNHFDKLDALLARLITELNIDTDKFYLAGQSMGGNGAWEYGAKNLNMFAALVPVCGYVARKDPKTGERVAEIAEVLKNKPIYVFHAANDSVVSVEHSDGMVESLKKAGNTNVLYTRYDDAPGFPAGGGKGHASYELAFKEEKLYKWLLEQSLSGNKSDL